MIYPPGSTPTRPRSDLAELTRRRARLVERLDGGRRGVLPRVGSPGCPLLLAVVAGPLFMAVNDVRFVKDGVARALRMLRTATSPAVHEPVHRPLPVSSDPWSETRTSLRATSVWTRSRVLVMSIVGPSHDGSCCTNDQRQVPPEIMQSIFGGGAARHRSAVAEHVTARR